MKSLPLYVDESGRPAAMCYRSGFCCKQAPCPFGVWEKNQCKHLQKDKNGKYECGIAEKITQKEGWEISPAFGAGCCSPFNSDRRAIIERLTKH